MHWRDGQMSVTAPRTQFTAAENERPGSLGGGRSGSGGICHQSSGGTVRGGGWPFLGAGLYFQILFLADHTGIAGERAARVGVRRRRRAIDGAVNRAGIGLAHVRPTVSLGKRYDNGQRDHGHREEAGGEHRRYSVSSGCGAKRMSSPAVVVV